MRVNILRAVSVNALGVNVHQPAWLDRASPVDTHALACGKVDRYQADHSGVCQVLFQWIARGAGRAHFESVFIQGSKESRLSGAQRRPHPAVAVDAAQDGDALIGQESLHRRGDDRAVHAGELSRLGYYARSFLYGQLAFVESTIHAERGDAAGPFQDAGSTTR